MSIYNQSCCHAFSGGILGLNTFVEGILRAAESSLEKMPNGKRKNYITRNTWNQIEERNQLRSNGAPSQEVHRLNKEISKQARLDPRNHLIEKFNENPNDPNIKGLWRAVKDLKRKFTPQYAHMKNLHVARVPISERAQALATYLEKIIGKTIQKRVCLTALVFMKIIVQMKAFFD